MNSTEAMNKKKEYLKQSSNCAVTTYLNRLFSQDFCSIK